MNRRITIELDDETVGFLAEVGEPIDVLMRLAYSAADGLRSRRPPRDQTDVRLADERAEEDALATKEREGVEKQADAHLESGRQLEDVIARAAEQCARDAGVDSQTADANATSARLSVENGRADEDAEIARERAQRRQLRTDLIGPRREATDHGLTGERVNTDALIVDLREANEKLLMATLHAQEMTDELRESEERYRVLFDLCPAGLYSCDGAGVIQNFNRHAAALWGHSPEPGATDEQFCRAFKLFARDGEPMPYEQTPMAAVLSDGVSDVRDTEVMLERPDGSRVTVVMNVRGIRNQRGQLVEALNCFHDISDRKQAEIRLGESLTAERELSEFREMFIGVLGHDLRTPLSAISMSASVLLQRGHLDEADTKVVTRILRSYKRMAEMITQLLDLTRARLGGGLPIERKPGDLASVIRTVVEEFEGDIRVELDGDFSGHWDADRMSQAISNLVANAIQYATPGSPVVIEATAEDAEVTVEVVNRGEPIPASVLPFIFEPFRRARKDEKSATGNLGLGLYIAQQIVRSHGGTLEGHSAEGTTRFVIRVPRNPPPPRRGGGIAHAMAFASRVA